MGRVVARQFRSYTRAVRRNDGETRECSHWYRSLPEPCGYCSTTLPLRSQVGEPWLHSLTYSTRMGTLAGMMVCHKVSSVDQSVTQFRLVQRNANRNQEQTIYDR